MATPSPFDEIVATWQLPRQEVEQIQLSRLNALLAQLKDSSGFYASRLSDVALPLDSLHQLRQIPLLTKAELIPEAPGMPGKHFLSTKIGLLTISPNQWNQWSPNASAGHATRLGMVDGLLATRPGVGGGYRG